MLKEVSSRARGLLASKSSPGRQGVADAAWSCVFAVPSSSVVAWYLKSSGFNKHNLCDTQAPLPKSYNGQDILNTTPIAVPPVSQCQSSQPRPRFFISQAAWGCGLLGVTDVTNSCTMHELVRVQECVSSESGEEQTSLAILRIKKDIKKAT